jgi:hypothetical protein
MKDGFILYCSHYPAINKLSNEDKGKLLDAIFQYHIESIDPEFDSFPVELAFSFLKQQFDRDQDKYLNTVERNRTNGIKGGRPKKPDEPKQPSGITGILEEPRKADKDKDKDNVKDKEIKKKDNSEIPNLNQNEKFLLSIPSEWKTIVSKWLEFKKDKQQPYKGLTSLNTMFDKLKKFSNENPLIGMEIIENSISNNYSGFFKQKDKTQHSMILHQSKETVENF